MLGNDMGGRRGRRGRDSYYRTNERKVSTHSRIAGCGGAALQRSPVRPGAVACSVVHAHAHVHVHVYGMSVSGGLVTFIPLCVGKLSCRLIEACVSCRFICLPSDSRPVAGGRVEAHATRADTKTSQHGQR